MARGPNPQKRFTNLGVITTGFGDKTEQEAFHGGVDIANSSGTPIRAPVDGVVTKVEGGRADGENSFGNTLELRDADGQVHQFHHLQNMNVKLGMPIKKGAQVATIGRTGAVYSPSGGDPSNLDYRIVNRYNQYINPLMYAKYL